ncbi:MAG: succinate dehydrogenase assembly factor 2 [Rhizobiaceae bacterium]
MTGTRHTGEGLDVRRRKLLFRSWHRGMREMDLILGSFADAEIENLTDGEIGQYEALLEISDTELMPWLTGKQPAPVEASPQIVNKIMAFRQTLRF